jgi:hypothetical protein
MTIAGTMTDDSSGKPLPGVVFTVYSTGDTTATPMGTFQSGSDGSYSYTNTALDMAASASVSAALPGYGTEYGSPGYFDGANTMIPLQVTVSSIPSWVWIAVGVAAIIILFYAYKNYKK